MAQTTGRLSGKTALITGGNSGIGLASAREFIAEGARVLISGRDAQSLAIAQKDLGPSCTSFRADVSRLEEIELLLSEAQSHLGKLDILFVNAGIAKFRPLTEIDESSYQETMDINVKGAFFTIQKALPILNRGASVILTSSSVIEKGVPGASVYSASKAAVRSLARTFSVELLPRQIRVNVISPGPVDTPIFARMGMTEEQLRGMNQSMQSLVPLKRMGEAREIARVAVFLASDDSSFLLGAEIAADGGISQL